MKKINRELQQHWGRGWATQVHYTESWECGAEKNRKEISPWDVIWKDIRECIFCLALMSPKVSLYPISPGFKKSGERPQGCTKHGYRDILRENVFKIGTVAKDLLNCITIDRLWSKSLQVHHPLGKKKKKENGLIHSM